MGLSTYRLQGSPYAPIPCHTSLKSLSFNDVLLTKPSNEHGFYHLMVELLVNFESNTEFCDPCPPNCQPCSGATLP